MRVNGTADGITKIVRHEGMRTLYRGLVPTLVMSVPSTVIYFLGYESMRERTKNCSIILVCRRMC